MGASSRRCSTPPPTHTGCPPNGAEPWKLPSVDSLPDISTDFASDANGENPAGEPVHHPYVRDPDTMARSWALPGTPGLEHRVGGLEKEDGTGNVSYSPENHEKMTHLRQAKIDAIARDIPDVVVDGDGDADLVVIGWGSTWGAISGGIDRVRARGKKVARIHLRHLNPLPPNLGELLSGFSRFLVPEMNLGQLSKVLRAEFLVDAKSVNKVRGLPFTASEIEVAILEHMEDA